MAAKVYLVGAGPGSPELLTVKALQLLRAADVVLHDDLVSDEILALISPQTRQLNVGKRCKHKLVTQEQINSLLLGYAKSTNVVVRLKCGDPSFFGRASEEIQALRSAGVDFEIVPGITAASAAAATAGISLTNGGSNASSLEFITAHQALAKPRAFLRRLSPDSTIVVYMPSERYGEIGLNLIKAGMGPQTPCVIVSAVSTREETLHWTVAGDLAGLHPPAAPALLIMGNVARNGCGGMSPLMRNIYAQQFGRSTMHASCATRLCRAGANLLRWAVGETAMAIFVQRLQRVFFNSGA